MADSNRFQGRCHMSENQEFLVGSFVVFRAFANLKIIYMYVTYFQPCLQFGGPRAKSGYPYFISKFINRENVGESMQAINEI